MLVIPPEILKRGKVAVEIYKKALRKGKQKIPRCNLLILGEERTGKTSLYRLLVGKGFNPHQDSTKGIDNTVVETVDIRHVASDTWEEKVIDDQHKQSKSLFAHGVVKEVKKELEIEKKVDSIENFYHSNQKLMNDVYEIERCLAKIDLENQQKYSHSFGHPSQHSPCKPADSHAGLREVRPAVPIVASKPTLQPYAAAQPGTGSKVVEDLSYREKSSDDTLVAEDQIEHMSANQNAASGSTPKKDAFEEKVSKRKPTKQFHSVGHLPTVQLSRGHSKEISKLMKSKGQEYKVPLLVYNTLDFAGQKEYHPMHHCFITRRAVYLVVFNLQKMINYLTKKKPTADNPLEQIRYWLHSIHAHIFPANKKDHMRRVCLVGTHRAPIDGEEITEENMKQIDDNLRTLEDDDRCVSHLHYTSKPERIFVAVENSLDNKAQREISGAVQLQRELKEVSENLKFLNEDHPITWLTFEAQLLESCIMRKSEGLSLVVPVQDVFAMASQHGIETKEDQCLALDFFHDTGKIIYLSKFLSVIRSSNKCYIRH